MQPVPLETVRPEDVLENWLWEFVPSRDGRHWVKPVKLPRTRKFSGRLAGGTVRFADGSTHVALIKGISPDMPESSRHNRELIIWVPQRGWFTLAQYFDSDELKRARGDAVLCKLVGKSMREVFPIEFDLRDRSLVDSPCLTGAFEHNPPWGLSQSKIMALGVRELAAAEAAARKKRKR